MGAMATIRSWKAIRGSGVAAALFPTSRLPRSNRRRGRKKEARHDEALSFADCIDNSDLSLERAGESPRQKPVPVRGRSVPIAILGPFEGGIRPVPARASDGSCAPRALEVRAPTTALK